MVVWRPSSRFVYFLALVAAFLAGYYLHSTSLSAQSQAYFQSLLKQAGASQQLAQDGTTATSDISLNTDQNLSLPLPSEVSSAASTHPTETTDTTEIKEGAAQTTNAPGYSPDRLFFQNDIEYDYPKFNVSKLQAFAPRNYKGPGHAAFATFYLSRNASMQDPYYLATLQIVYRLLWDPISRSKQYPVVVFVAPFVTDEQRSYFEASGALVREVAQHPFVPNQDTKGPLAERLKDVFSKLEMWNQTDFTRLAYLDSDAFPLINIDLIMAEEIVPSQTCNQALLPEKDRDHASDICEYCFGAVREFNGMLNAGVMVLKPSEAMYTSLMREYQDGQNFDNGFVEQALLTYVFRQDGPFPPTVLAEAWNGTPLVRDQGRALFILHAKIWALFFNVNHWAASLWEDTWNDMLQLYEDSAFERIRAQDDARAHPQQHHSSDISKWDLDG